MTKYKLWIEKKEYPEADNIWYSAFYKELLSDIKYHIATEDSFEKAKKFLEYKKAELLTPKQREVVFEEEIEVNQYL